MLIHRLQKTLDPFGGQDEGVVATGRDDRAVVGRVECHEFFDGHAGKSRCEAQVNRAQFLQRGEIGFVRDFRQDKS